jgi:hypothetical protein
MAIIRLVLTHTAVKPKETVALFAEAKIDRPYFPIRGLPPSLVIHVIALAAFNFFASFAGVLPKRSIPQEKIVMIDLNDPLSVMLLPAFEGGDQRARVSEEGSEAKPAKPPEAAPKTAALPKPKAVPAAASEPESETPVPPSTTTKGFSYPGPQPIISDVEAPTNRFQTLLQPDLKNLPVLPPPVLIPNVVQIADLIKVPQMGEPPPPPEPEETPPPKNEPAPAPKPQEPPKPAPKPIEPPMLKPKPPEPPPKPSEPPIPAPKPIAPPKPEPKPPEPAPKPVEPAQPEPKPALTLEPEPIPVEPAPKAIEPPKSEPKQVEVPKPEPKAPEPAPKRADVAKPAPVPEKKPEQKQPQPATKTAEQKTAQQPVPATPAPKKANPNPPAGPSATAPPEETPKASDLAASLKTILSLSPMPGPPDQLVKIPMGEARGRFAIAPKPDLSGSDAEPGFKTGIASPKIGIGNSEGAPARKGVATKTAPVASAKAGPVGASGNGKPAPGGAATGSAGTTRGGSGTATGGGNGSGSAAAQKPFAGITIVGGGYEPGSDTEEPAVKYAVRPLQTAYGINIISTEDSGGGLPFFGVFSHEQIYTVYLDMRIVEADQDPSWTLEFAVMQDDSSSSVVTDLSRMQQGVVLPFPTVKEKPVWPAELAGKYSGKMIIVFGVINTEGKMEQISIKDSPNPLLNEPVIKALGKWTFRPAQAGGQPVRAKALFGIPLWVPE